MTDDTLRELAAQLPHDRPTIERTERVRSSLLATAARPAPPRPRRWLLVGGGFAAGALAAAAIAILVLRSPAPAPAHEAYARIESSSAAAVEHTLGATASGGTDEVVRVRAGTLRLAVPAPRAGDRVRVATADAEIEGAGEYEVVVARDALERVTVTAGRATIRIAGKQEAVFLAAGQTWRAAIQTADLTPDASAVERAAGSGASATGVAAASNGGLPPNGAGAAAATNGGTSSTGAGAAAATNGGTSSTGAGASRIASPSGANLGPPSATAASSAGAASPSAITTTSGGLPPNGAGAASATSGGTSSTGADAARMASPSGENLGPSSASSASGAGAVSPGANAGTASAGAGQQLSTSAAPNAPVAKQASETERRFRAGTALLRANKLAEAVAELGAAADAGDTSLAADARYFQAVALVKAKRGAEAERALVRFLDSAPTSIRRGRAAMMLGRLLADRGDAKTAREWFGVAANDPDPAVATAARAALGPR